jgi:hypothetical protein
MDVLKRDKCRKFFAGLPNAPRVANAAYIPDDNVVLLPFRDDNSYLYYKLLWHEIAHQRLCDIDLPSLIGFEIEDEDFLPLEELICEVVAVLISCHLDMYNAVEKEMLDYIREWKGNLRNKQTLLPKVFEIAELIASDILDRAVTKYDLPSHVRVLLGLF